MARRRSSRDAPRIQQLRWDGANYAFSSMGAGTAALVYITAANDTETLMRIRGELVCWVDGLEAPAPAFEVGIGLIVMPEGQSTTVVSSPLSDANAPWLMYESFLLGYEEYVTDVIDAPGLSVFRKTIDVKSQRILRPDREVQIVVENTTIISAGSLNLSFSSRVLFGKH